MGPALWPLGRADRTVALLKRSSKAGNFGQWLSFSLADFIIPVSEVWASDEGEPCGVLPEGSEEEEVDENSGRRTRTKARMKKSPGLWMEHLLSEDCSIHLSSWWIFLVPGQTD